MRRLSVLVLIFITCYCKAQEQKSFAVSYGIGAGKIGSLDFSGSKVNTNTSLNIFGLNYWSEIKKDLFFETGIQLIRCKYTTTEMNTGIQPANTPMSSSIVARMINMYNAPFKLRYQAGEYIFFNGGIIIDLSRSTDLSGIGASIGVGLQVKTFKGISIFLNPQANIHSLLNFKDTRIFPETNLSFGLSYKIN